MIKPPPNPHADAARAAMREYFHPALTMPEVVTALEQQALPLPDSEVTPDAALLSAVLVRWPDAARYAATARVETLTIMNARTREWEQGPCVTVTVIDSPCPGTGAGVSESACDSTQKGETK